MTIALLATGDELVHGDTLNTNSHAIAQILSSEGLPLGLHISCSDKEADIINCLNFLAKNHDIIIITGGLGPTTDDLTRFALARYTGEPLVVNEQALASIEQRLTMAKVTMNEGNKQQALFPESATILPNPNGSAVGCCYVWHTTTFFLLPGPPRECLPMFQEFALPLLQKTHHSSKHILKWLIFGLAESEIAEVLENALKDIDCHTGYRVDVPYIEFKVRCEHALVSKVHSIVDPILAPHSVAPNHEKASQALLALIQSYDQRVTIIDDATGGHLECLLNKPEIHKLLCFNKLKKNTLSFHITGLSEYWSHQNPNGKTQLVIHYKNQTQEGKETHEIPYRTSLVVHYAAEWLCFRLFHLINQLH